MAQHIERCNAELQQLSGFDPGRPASAQWHCIKLVIPAQAGIHLVFETWIPACAGMTEYENLARSA